MNFDNYLREAMMQERSLEETNRIVTEEASKIKTTSNGRIIKSSDVVKNDIRQAYEYSALQREVFQRSFAKTSVTEIKI